MSLDFMPSRRRHELQYNCSTAQNLVRYNVTQNSAEATASAVTIQIDNPSGTSVLSSTAMSQDTGTDSQWTYTVNTSTVASWPVGEGYKALITYTISTVAYVDVFYLDVVRHQLVFTATDDDLAAFEHDLANWKLTGHTTWAHKLRHAEDAIRNRLRQKANQDGHGRPGLVVGYDQLKRWHLLWTIESIARDAGQATAFESYREDRKDEQEAVLSSLVYSVGDEEDPGAPEPENFGLVRLTR